MCADHSNNEVWNESFSETARGAQRQEDSDAWYAVTGLLIAIISVGVTLAAFTVFVVSQYSGV
ncbi:MAG: hypothetical protein CMJ64_00920 [Planctomycetaceae bacterium]|nr:hypothetical protein [Planctomycetaceae bacterium]